MPDSVILMEKPRFASVDAVDLGDFKTMVPMLKMRITFDGEIISNATIMTPGSDITKLTSISGLVKSIEDDKSLIVSHAVKGAERSAYLNIVGEWSDMDNFIDWQRWATEMSVRIQRCAEEVHAGVAVENEHLSNPDLPKAPTTLPCAIMLWFPEGELRKMQCKVLMRNEYRLRKMEILANAE